MKKFLITLVACLFFPTAALANALTNGGFETGNFYGWTVGGNASSGVAVDGTAISGTYYSNNVVNVHDGTYAAFASVSQSSGIYLTLEQTIQVEADTTYDVGFWLSIGASGSAGRNYEIIVNGTKILDIQKTGSETYDYWYGTDATNYLHEYAQYTTGADETSLTVRFYLSGSGTALVGFSYDDFYFDEAGGDPPSPSVPEPATMLLLGLGLFAVVGMRKLLKK